MARVNFFLKPFIPIFEVRREERAKTWLMFLYFFFTVAVIYILKPVRSSLFLSEHGAKNLRYAYMSEGVFLIFVVTIYTYFARRLPQKIFFPAVLLFFASNLAAFWGFFRADTPFMAAFFYVWVASFSITATTQFWILANDLFNSGAAKRLFGLIISGGSLGGILGGVLTQQAVHFVKTEDLLLVAAALLVLCALIVTFVWKNGPSGISGKRTAPEPAPAENEKGKAGVKFLKGSSYLIFLTLLVIIAKVSATIVDNQFNRIVEITIAGKEARTGFLAGFMAWLNAAAFLMQFVFTGALLRGLGVSLSLWILPAGLAAVAGGGFFLPVFLTGLGMKIYEGSMNYSIQQACKEMLYLPLSSQTRYRFKPVIDMLGFRGAKTLAGIYIAVAAPLLGLADERLGVLILLLLPFWAILIWKIQTGYSKLMPQEAVKQKSIAKEFSSQREGDEATGFAPG